MGVVIKVKRPIIWLTLFFAWGIYFFIKKEIRIFSVIFIVASIIYAIKRKFGVLFIISNLIFFILGISLCYSHNNKINYVYNKYNKYNNEKNNMYATGVIERVEYKEKTVAIWLKFCKIEKKSLVGDIKDGRLNILVYYPLDIEEDINKLEIGYIIKINGQLLEFEKASNYGQFNEYKYYVNQLGFHYKMYSESIEVVNKKTSIIYIIKRKLNMLSLNMQKNIDKLYKDKKKGVIKAILLGEKSMLDDDVKRLYNKAGISHILAISGLHITLIGMTLYNIFLKIKVNMYVSSVLTCSLVVLYGIMTHFSVSTNRAVVMMIFMLLSKFFKRSFDVLNSCCMSLIFILMQNPYMIENCGLQLSYLAIIAIMTVYPILYSIIEKKGLKKSSIKLYIEVKTGNIEDFRYVLSVCDAIYKIYDWLVKSVISALSVYVVTLPVVINNFYEIKIFGMILSVLIIPTVNILLTMIILSLILVLMSWDLGCVCAGSVDVLLSVYEKMGLYCDKVNFSTVTISHKGVAFIVIYYGLLYGVLYVCKNKKLKSLTLVLKHKLTFKIIILCVVTLVGFNYQNKELEVNMLDVGQGDCTCIITPRKKVVLIDCGSSDIQNIYKYRLEGYLKYKGIKIIDYIFISHMDNDHVSGVFELLETKNSDIKLKNIVITRQSTYDEKYKRMLTLASKSNVNIKVFNEGDTAIIDQVLFTCIYPQNNIVNNSNNEDINESSMVLHILYKQWDALYTGDISKRGEEYAIEKLKRNNRTIDILKVPHHGSRYSSHDKFVDMVKPKIALFSAGRDNSYGHPDKAVINKYITKGAHIYNTVCDGMIEIKTNGHNMMHNKYIE